MGTQEFVKPCKVFVDVKSYLETLLPNGLEKDLNETDDYVEEICQICHGTGVVKEDNNFMLQEDNGYMHGTYKKQSVRWCPNCYNGVVRRCKYCGKLLSKGRLKCDCETIRKMERDKEREAELKALAKAQELDSDALGTRFGMCHSDDYHRNEGYFSDWDEFFDHWYDQTFDNGGVEPPRPEYVWGTYDVEMSIDANNIVENATCDLYEDAYDAVSDKAMKELQEFLDDWCSRCGVGKTYSQSKKYKVRIPWEEYDTNDPQMSQVWQHGVGMGGRLV